MRHGYKSEVYPRVPADGVENAWSTHPAVYRLRDSVLYNGQSENRDICGNGQMGGRRMEGLGRAMKCLPKAREKNI